MRAGGMHNKSAMFFASLLLGEITFEFTFSAQLLSWFFFKRVAVRPDRKTRQQFVFPFIL